MMDEQTAVLVAVLSLLVSAGCLWAAERFINWRIKRGLDKPNEEDL